MLLQNFLSLISSSKIIIVESLAFVEHFLKLFNVDKI